MTTFDRFQTAYDYLRKNGAFKSKAELARILKRGYAGVVSACNGNAPEFNKSFIADFAKTFHLSQSWLLNGEGEMLAPQPMAGSVSVSPDLLERLYAELHSLRQEVADLRQEVASLRVNNYNYAPSLAMVADDNN